MLSQAATCPCVVPLVEAFNRLVRILLGIKASVNDSKCGWYGLTTSLEAAALSYFVQSMTHTRTVCSLYTRALQGALGKHILILIPFHSIPFYSIPFHSILFYSILFYSILFHVST